jgi:hypothetical protein
MTYLESNYLTKKGVKKLYFLLAYKTKLLELKSIFQIINSFLLAEKNN